MLADSLRGPRGYRLLFMAAMTVLAGTLAWLGWALVARDAQVERHRRSERRDTTADRAVVVIERHLTAAADLVSRSLAHPGTFESQSIAEGAVLVEFRAGAVHAWPSGRLPFVPATPQTPPPPDPVLLRADELERQGDHDGALEILGAPAASAEPSRRAQALVRVARSHAKRGRMVQALSTYANLAKLDAVSVAGMPATLAARVGELAVFEKQDDRAALQRTAETIARDVRSGRWELSAATYEYLTAEAARWYRDLPSSDDGRFALAEAVATLWSESAAAQDGEGSRRSVTTSAGPVLLVWSKSGGTTVGLAATSAHVRDEWLKPVELDVRLTSPTGDLVVGDSSAPAAEAAVRLSSTTRMPWTIEAFDAPDAATLTAFSSRRRLFIASLAAVLAVFISGAWFVSRSVAKEIEVARLQANFVSAVSHEFRTPLTTLCQLSELLSRGRVASEVDKQRYYTFLHRESDRLRRLVEGLLSFGRVESGTVEFRFAPLDPAGFARDTAAEFALAHPTMRHRIDVHAEGDAPSVTADRDALRLALWNLLDNAVKYSPGRDVIHVTVVPDGRRVQIAVRDEGLGIPRGDERRIFEKFSRGAAASEHDIRGTGIGLTTAREIVRAHNGTITVDSQPGHGSTFRIALPAA